jgi:microcystin degradation protein MlrC
MSTTSEHVPESPRVLVAGFSIEGNSFVPAETTRADFEDQVWVIGDQLGRDSAGATSELAGAWDALVAAGMTPVGAIVAVASPGAPAAREVLDAVVDELLARCTPEVAGAYVMLHGAALVTGIDDPEGVLLAALRDRLGEDAPIAISLDLHAYLTDRMTAAADIVTAYRTCPHVDLYRTGHQAGGLLARTVAGSARPTAHRIRLPMITPPERHDSTQDPFRRLQRLCDEAEREGALAAALCCTQPWVDVPELGWSVLVTTDDDPVLAERLANRIAAEAWAARTQFLHSSAVPVGEAVAAAFATDGPFVVADIGDATNGGSLGDSTEVLRALLARRDAGAVSGPSAVSITDPAAVAAAAAAGEGASVVLDVGTGSAGAFNARTSVRGVVRRLWEGTLVYTHPASPGVEDSPGPCAVLEVGDITVVLHSSPVRVIDPSIYLAVGVDIAAQRLLQAKSHVSYRAGFDPVSTGSVLADTRGPTAADLSSLPFTRRPRPLFPFEDAVWEPSA